MDDGRRGARRAVDVAGDGWVVVAVCAPEAARSCGKRREVILWPQMMKNSVVILQGGFVAGRQQAKMMAMRRKVIANVGNVNMGV